MLANVLQDISTEVALGIAAALALAVIFVVMRSRVSIGNAKKAKSTTAQPVYPPPPKNPPLRPDQIVLRLDRSKNREPAPLLVMPPRPVVAAPRAVPPPAVAAAPVDTSTPVSERVMEKRKPSERALDVESLPVVRGPVGAGEQAPVAVPSPELSVGLLRQLEWKRFELLVQRYFEAGGLRTKCSGLAESGGVHLQLFRGENPDPFSVVHCLAGEGRAVPLEAVIALFGSIPASPVEIVLVASSHFSPGAQAFAQTKRIILLTGDTLVARFNALPGSQRAEILAEVVAGDYTTPSCRLCDLKLVLAAAEEGQPRQWSCPRTPRCTFSLPVRT